MKFFTSYVKHFHTFYQRADKYDYGDPQLLYNPGEIIHRTDLMYISYMHRPSDDTPIMFDDKNFNVRGTYEWKKEQVKHVHGEKESTIGVPYISIKLEKDAKTDVVKYFNNIIEKGYELFSEHIATTINKN